MVNIKGTLEDYSKVWYHPKAITNILGLGNIIKKYPVTYDSENGNIFVVHKPQGDRIFTMMSAGLWRFDVRDKRNFAFLETEKTIRENYTRREYEDAKRARDLLSMVGYPSSKDFKKMITHGLIYNCDVQVKDIDNATKIFGKSIFEMKGKSTRAKTEPVVEDYVAVPKSITIRHRDIILSIDLMFVQKQIYW